MFTSAALPALVISTDASHPCSSHALESLAHCYPDIDTANCMGHSAWLSALTLTKQSWNWRRTRAGRMVASEAAAYWTAAVTMSSAPGQESE